MAVSGKQPHYLLPLLPALALTAARLLVVAHEIEQNVYCACYFVSNNEIWQD